MATLSKRMKCPLPAVRIVTVYSLQMPSWNSRSASLSRRRSRQPGQNAADAFANGQIVQGIVTGWNRGGLLVRWIELQGFVPASQLKDVPIFEDDDSRDDKLARWVGEELDLKVIELDRSRNRLVFSERATVWGPKDGERVLAEIVPGEARMGAMSATCAILALLWIWAASMV